jgi:hypothetical protein
MPPLSHAVNVDFIGPARISDPTVQLPYPPPPFYAPAEYNTHTHIDKPSRHGERQVEVPLFGGETTTMSLGQGLMPIDTREVLSNVSIFTLILSRVITLPLDMNLVFCLNLDRLSGSDVTRSQLAVKLY